RGQVAALPRSAPREARVAAPARRVEATDRGSGRLLGEEAASPLLALEAETGAEPAARCPWVDVAVDARVALPRERRRRVRALQRRVERQHAVPVERRVLRQARPGGLVERRTPVGGGPGLQAGPRPVSDGDSDDAQAARGQLDRGMLLGIRPAEGDVRGPWPPADHVALVPAVDAGAQRLG